MSGDVTLASERPPTLPHKIFCPVTILLAAQVFFLQDATSSVPSRQYRNKMYSPYLTQFIARVL